MSLRRCAVLLVILSCFGGSVHGQRRRGGPVSSGNERVLSGRVLYAQTLEGAPQILVKLQGTTSSAGQQQLTTSDGLFEFRGLPRGSFVVEISEDGYQEVRVRVDLMYGSHDYITVLLKPEGAATSKSSSEVVQVRELQIPAKARKALEKGMRELNERKRPERSLRHFSQAIELYPEYDEAYVQMGLAHIELAEFPRAEEVLQKATRLDPGNARAYALLGIAMREQKEFEKSVEALRQAVKLDATNWQAHMELATMLLEMKQVEEAYEHAQRAHALMPQAPTVHLVLFNVYIGQRDYPAALAELDEFLELHPQDPLAPQVRQRRDSLRQSLTAAVE